MKVGPPKKRGPKVGSKMGPRTGSRVWTLSQMQPGERIFLEAPEGRQLRDFMSQINVDINRGGFRGKITQTLILGVQPDARLIIDLVMLSMKESTCSKPE